MTPLGRRRRPTSPRWRPGVLGPMLFLGLRRAAVWCCYMPAVLILVLYLLAFVDHGWSIVRFPYEVDYGEVPELNRAVLLAHGRQIYVDWSQPPYQMANYPPLYPLATSIGVRLDGVQFFTGRLLSFAST